MDDQSVYDIREGRGTLTSPGRNSPFRDRSVEENAELVARMRAGEFRNGERVLRAKIDMVQRTSTYATPSSTVFSTPAICAPAPSGTSTRAMTSRTASATPSEPAGEKSGRQSTG